MELYSKKLILFENPSCNPFRLTITDKNGSERISSGKRSANSLMKSLRYSAKPGLWAYTREVNRSTPLFLSVSTNSLLCNLYLTFHSPHKSGFQNTARLPEIHREGKNAHEYQSYLFYVTLHLKERGNGWG
ncbi:MAG: hypothetical protein C4291_09060 [Candidatus Dadabacteria bacterium]